MQPRQSSGMLECRFNDGGPRSFQQNYNKPIFPVKNHWYDNNDTNCVINYIYIRLLQTGWRGAGASKQ